MSRFSKLFDYESAGSGISKNAPQKKRIFVFFDIFFNKFWKLLGLNAIYMLFCCTIFLIGPATAGVTKVLRNFSQQRPVFLWGDFIESLKKNFKQGLAMGAIDVFVFISVALGCYNIIKNSFYLTCVCAKQSLTTFLICALIVIVGIFVFITNDYAKFCIILGPATIIGLIVCFNFYPIIQKYVINPYYEQTGEENPEYRYTKPVSEEETVFVDRGGQEAPIVSEKARKRQEKKQQKRKGRTIS